MADLHSTRRWAFIAAQAILVAAPLHAQSADDAFDPGADGAVNAVVVQADGKIVLGGAFTLLGGGAAGSELRHRLGRLNVDGSVDNAFDPGANGELRSLAVQEDGRILVGGAFTALGGGTGTTTRNYVGRFNPDGTLDSSFDPGADGPVNAIRVQADGRILLGGEFTAVGGGGSGVISRHHIARLNADGSVDMTFDPGANDGVDAIALDARNRILIGGRFARLGGGGSGVTTRAYLGRLNSDGSLDATFNPSVTGDVRALLVRPSGTILAGGAGAFLSDEPTPHAHGYFAQLEADGTVDETVRVVLNDTVYSLALQPDGEVVVGGAFTTYRNFGTSLVFPAGHLVRLGRDGNATGLSPADRPVFALAVQADGKIVVGGDFTTVGSTPVERNRVARLNDDGSLEQAFDPGVNGTAWAIAARPDGRIVIAGAFSHLGGGGTGTHPAQNVGGLRIDGSADSDFNAGADGAVRALAQQLDRRLLLGGHFSLLGSETPVPRNEVGRVHGAGNPDESFDAHLPAGGLADEGVRAMVLQPDAKVVIGGSFQYSLPGERLLMRLATDGAVEATFAPRGNGVVYAIALQADGKILIGGSFTTLGTGATETPRHYIARLHADGSLDAAFNPGATGPVNAILVQPDGKILVGGAFTAIGGGMGSTPRHYLARLHADGSVEESFDARANDQVHALALQTDGKIIVGGRFTLLGGGAVLSPRSRLGRLEPDGLLDDVFDAGADGDIRVVTIQRDGKLIAGGDFTTLGGGGTGSSARFRIGRVTNTGAAFDRLSVALDGTSVTWLRRGSGPEVWRVTFEMSPTAQADSYSALGDGTRIAGGWQLAGLQLPTNETIYVRATGYDLATGSTVESVLQAFAPCAAVTLSATVFPTGQAGVAYPSVTLTQTGGAGVTTFAITAGALPPGLSLSGAGVVSGTATASGTFGFTATAVDEIGCVGSRSYTVTTTATAPFTDDPVVSGVSLIRAIHITELRARIDGLRVGLGLPANSWTDHALVPGTAVKAVHVRELRTGLQQAYQAAGLQPPAYGDATIEAGVTLIRAAHLTELRSAVAALEGR